MPANEKEPLKAHTSKWKAVSYYTPNYEGVVEGLISSLKKFNIDYDIEAIESLGGWDENTYYKPQFLLRKLKEHKCNIVWLDADAELREYPKYFDVISEDVGVGFRHRSFSSREILSGVVFLKNNDAVKRFVEDWIYFCNKDKGKLKFEQVYLEESIIENCYTKYWVSIFYLPTSYLAIKGTTDKGHMTIFHGAASRIYKGNKGKIREKPLSDLHWDAQSGMAVFKTTEALNEYVDTLEKSIKIKGLKKPPLIRRVTDAELGMWKVPYRVLHGNHRCEVAKRLGWKTIDCEIHGEW